LTVTEKSDRLLLHCHAGCTPEAVCAALGISTADLFRKNGRATARQIVATYDYQDAAGKLLFQVVRFHPKDFRQRRPDPRAIDGWTWNTKGVQRVLFRLPELVREVAKGHPIFIPEGEKDCLALMDRGFASTCNPGGAGKWQNCFCETLRGADVVIIADKDAPGRAHAQTVARKLQANAKSVRVIELPDVEGKTVKDAFDFFAAGGDGGEIFELLDRTPEWTPGIVAGSAADGQSEIRGAIVSILTNDKLSPAEQRTQIAEAVVRALSERGQFYFHKERRDFESAMHFDRERKRLERIRSDAFCAWLSDWLRVNRADTLFRFILAAVETVALSGSQTTAILPESFWASRPGAIYISNGDGRAVKVTPCNVQLVDNGGDGVLFSAGNTLATWTLTTPQDPFLTCSVFGRANCIANHGPDLLRLWLLSLPTNPACKPPLCLAGDVGSGKTRMAVGIAELYGLPIVANAVEDFGEDSFWTSLDGGGLFTLDNADTRNKWLPDAVASAATGGCSQRRKLYTDSERVTLRARSWLCLTTANPSFASDAGLADRLLVIRMSRRTDETGESALSEEIRQHRDAGLSFIAHALSKALADTRPTPSRLNQRHPDFAAVAVRLGRAIGREAEAVHALKSAELDKSLFCLENDSIGAALLTTLQSAGQFTGTAKELRERLIEVDPDLVERLSVKRLGKRLSMLWPHLEKVLRTAIQEKDRNHFTIYTLKPRSADYAEFQTAFH
jgi:hypothetical protein